MCGRRLRLLEKPLSIAAWEGHVVRLQVVGEGRCPIVDTWWQTETGSIAITPLPGAWAAVPGSATLPFFGVKPVILDDKVGPGPLLHKSDNMLAPKRPLA